MNLNISLNSRNGRIDGREDVSRMIIDKDKKSGILAGIQKGQLITGTVLSVGGMVTLDFDGQKISTSKEVIKQAVPGERKTFEVVKASNTEIELKLIEGSALEQRKTLITAMIKDTDWDTVMAQKNHSAEQEEKDHKAKELKNKLEEISNKFTERDCYSLEKEGFPVEGFSINGLYEAISRVKEEALGKKKTDKTVDIHNTDQFSKEGIAARLNAENLPVTEQNINNIEKALALSKTISGLDDKAVKYLISGEVQPTIENIYKAYYSGSTNSRDNSQELTEDTWSKLEIQVKTVINNSGYEVNEANLADARWLIENKIPMTEQTFSYKKELEELKQNTGTENVLDRIIEGMKSGTAPKDVTLIEPMEGSFHKLISDINSISEAAITYAVHTNSQLTIQKLSAIQESIAEGTLSVDMITAAKVASEAGKIEAIQTETKTTQAGTAQIETQTTQAKTVQIETQNSQAIASQAERVSTETAKTESVQAEKSQIKTTQTERVQTDSVQQTVDEIAQNSSNLSGDNSSRQESQNSAKDYRYEEIKAQRQLEEIRLKMTLDAAQTMEKKGISVDTQELEKVVEELRRLEDSYYNRLLKEADVEATEEALQTLKATTQSIKQLSGVPSYVLGRTLTQQSTQTITSLLSEGSKLQAEFEKAGTAYETLMTIPNSEYGDSIRKAFANMDSLLSELNIDNTAENQRAVRILGYNQMEITTENINRVKAYDKEVTSLMSNLHPSVAVRMIKEGINPLNTPISQLNNEIERMKEEQGITSEEKFSTYLQKLERNNAISVEERKAYIGIYRLLYNIEKSDGAALGSVIRTGREVTLSNLLTAVQTGRKGRLDAIINEEFGTLSELSRSKESISEQLSTFNGSARQQDQNQEQVKKAEQLEEQTQYQSRILEQITQEISPEKINQMQQSLSQTAEYIYQAGAAQPQSKGNQNQSGVNTTQNQSRVNISQNQNNVWDEMKDLPLEKLLQQLQNADDAQDITMELYSQKVEQLRQLNQTSEQSIRFLKDYQISCTPQNMMVANHLLSNGESPIVKLLRRQQENSIENEENSLKNLKELSDKLIDKASMNEAIENLEISAKETLEKACSQETLDSRRLAELKSIGQQVTFLRTLASKEFYQIPIETAKGITNLNLTILRGAGNAGCVSVTVKSGQLGDMKAEFTLKDQNLKGFITGDNRDGIEKLQVSIGELEKAANEEDITIKQVDFVINRRENDTYSYQNPETGESTAAVGSEAERKLYRIAKAFIQTVRLAEGDDELTQRAVS